MKRLLSFLSAVFVSSGAANAQVSAPPPPPPPEEIPRWLSLYEGESMSLLIDRTTVQDEGTEVKVWFEWRHTPAKETADGEIYDSSRDNMHIDCSGHRFRSLYYVNYNDGQVVSTIPTPESWRPVVPGTIGESFVDQVCAVYGSD
jgi:hypothetical protein